MYAIQNPIIPVSAAELTLDGNCGYHIYNGRIAINIGNIANRREHGNLSGTLSIELWALQQPYRGGQFSGLALAGTTIGELKGQHFIGPSTWELAAQEPAEGEWYLTLMLREWNGLAYETRDFVNFAVPYVAAGKPAVVRNPGNNVINVSFVEYKKAISVNAQSGHTVCNESAIEAQATKPAAAGLALHGNCGYEVLDKRITLHVGEIANLRAENTVSGDLSLELWALKQAYQDGDFDGFALAGIPIGELCGKHSIYASQYELDYQEPPEGTWQLSLMLREWNGQAYETRDCINFALPLSVRTKNTVSRKDPDNVINLGFQDTKKTVAPAKLPVAAVATPRTTSINLATADQLAELKGVPKKTVDNIVAAQPFDSFDDLSKVKGVGPKLLKLLRELFSL